MFKTANNEKKIEAGVAVAGTFGIAAWMCGLVAAMLLVGTIAVQNTTSFAKLGTDGILSARR
jgi:phosphoribosylcarboxyaminoimidazole (NCAIR) mutase